MSPAPSPVLDTPGADSASNLAVLAGKWVLVVDDNDFNLDVACGLLQDIHMHVVMARDGVQALEALQRRPFDCVLMDVQMPTMDGHEATRRIRSNPATATTVVLAMTANAGEEDRQRCLECGMYEVITKPIDPDLLFATLARWIQRSTAAVAQASPQPPAAAVALPGTHPAPGNGTLAAIAAAQTPAAPLVPLAVLWDNQALMRIVGDNPQVQARLLDKYRSTACETVAALEVCAAQAQWPAAGDLAHKLKSSSRTVGAMRLGALCEQLEHAGRQGDAALSAALVQQVLATFAEVQAYLGH